MRIVADQAVPYARRFFSTLGEVTLLDSAALTPAEVRDADCLVVRSVTRVDERLLAGSRVRCLASTSSGTDHIDEDYLRARAIPLFTAKGSNARAVAEYVLSCLFALSEQDGFDLADKTVGIIGCGQVGGQLLRLTKTLGLNTRVYDPFIRDDDDRFVHQELDEVSGSDVITLHVPLTATGEYPTAGMVDSNFLGRLETDVIFINTARGGVVDERALIDFAKRNPASRLALDVWDNEPHINLELLNLAVLATPHIAGYSARAKLNATRMIYEQICARFNEPVAMDGDLTLWDEDSKLTLAGFEHPVEAIKAATLASYDVRGDCAALKEIELVEPQARRDFFTLLRTDYPFRREFSDLRVAAPGNDRGLPEILSDLGFNVAD